MFTVIFSNVQNVIGSRNNKALWLDVEQDAGLFHVVLRSRDKYVIGATESPEQAEKFWNDESGAPRPFIVATSDSRDVADTVVAQIVDFYEQGERDDEQKLINPVSDRIDAVGDGARALLLLLLPIFGIAKPQRLGSFNAKQEKRAAATKALEQTATKVVTAKAEQALASGKLTAEQAAAVQAFLATL